MTSMNLPAQHVDKKGDEKFMEEDLPKIHAAVERARRARANAKVIIDVAENGGIISISMETKSKFK
jgi:hypothetical protein